MYSIAQVKLQFSKDKPQYMRTKISQQFSELSWCCDTLIVLVFVQRYIIVCLKCCLTFAQPAHSCWCKDSKTVCPFTVCIQWKETTFLWGNTVCIMLVFLYNQVLLVQNAENEWIWFVSKYSESSMQIVWRWGQIEAKIKMGFLYVSVEQRLRRCPRKPVCISHAMQPRCNTLRCH